MDKERKCETLSILKTPTSALATQGLGGSARMLNGLPVPQTILLVLFFHLNESNPWVQFCGGRGGVLGRQWL